MSDANKIIPALDESRIYDALINMRVCGDLDDFYAYRSVRVSPYASCEPFKFCLGVLQKYTVGFCWDVTPSEGRNSERVSTFVSIAPHDEEIILDMEKELRKLLLGREFTSSIKKNENENFRSSLKIHMDETTQIFTRGISGIEESDLTSCRKNTRATMDIELDGFGTKMSLSGDKSWFPFFRARQIVIHEGVGVYTKPGIPLYLKDVSNSRKYVEDYAFLWCGNDEK